MPQLKFKINITTEENSVIKYFSNAKGCAEFLEISLNTFYALRNNKLKLIHQNKKKLKGITVERLPVYYYYKPNIIKQTEDILKYKEKIMLK